MQVRLTLALSTLGPSVQQTPRNFALTAPVCSFWAYNARSTVPYPICKRATQKMRKGPMQVKGKGPWRWRGPHRWTLSKVEVKRGRWKRGSGKRGSGKRGSGKRGTRLQGGKRGSGKRGTRRQGWKTPEWKSMESQKSLLFNIVTSVLQQPLELMWTRRTLLICIFLLYKQGEIVSPFQHRLGLNVSYPVLTRSRETDSLVACKVLRYVSWYDWW